MPVTGARPLQKVFALAGLAAVVAVVPVVVWLLGGSVLPLVVLVVALVALVSAVGVLVRVVIARRFPAVPFDPADVAQAAVPIDDAKARLAARDHAAFVVSADVGPDEPEAVGQIWFHADASGGIERTSVEVAYWVATPPADHPALAELLGRGFVVDGWQADHWVLLTRPGDLDSADAVRLVVAALGRLSPAATSAPWTVRAFA